MNRVHNFTAKIELIGINPFVFVPEQILTQIFKDAGKDKGYIPICGTVNETNYLQTLVKYKGYWRLYINTKMLSNSPKRIGEIVAISIAFDNQNRTLEMHPKLGKAFDENQYAKSVFDSLTASKQKEIIRYISFLRTEKSISKNIDKAIGFLKGQNKFIGRNNP